MLPQSPKTPKNSTSASDQQRKASTGSNLGLTGGYGSVLASPKGGGSQSSESVPSWKQASATSILTNSQRLALVTGSLKSASLEPQSQSVPEETSIVEIFPEPPTAAEQMLAQEKGHRIVVLKAIGRRILVSQQRLIAVQRLIRRRILLWRFIALVRVMVARVRHHKLMAAYLNEFKNERVATLMQSVVRSWLIRRRWRLAKVKTLTESRKNSLPARPESVSSPSTVRRTTLALLTTPIRTRTSSQIRKQI